MMMKRSVLEFAGILEFAAGVLSFQPLDISDKLIISHETP
jgi:hypothetical protein